MFALSHARSQAKALEQIWRITERPARGVVGLTKWRPYEDLPWPLQQATLEAAAVAIHLIETGAITAQFGDLAVPLRITGVNAPLTGMNGIRRWASSATATSTQFDHSVKESLIDLLLTFREVVAIP